MFRKLLVWLLTLCPSLLLFAQSNDFPKDDVQKQPIFVGTSPSVLKHGDGDFSYVNSMNSYWIVAQYQDKANDATYVLNRYRKTDFQQLFRFTYGYSKTENWDLGVELRLARSRFDDYARNSPFKVFANDSKDQTENLHGVSTVGFRFRYMPNRTIPEWTTYTTVQFPLANSREKQLAFGQFRSSFALGSTFYQQISPKLYAFYQGEYAFLPRNKEMTFAKTGESFPNNKNTHNISLNTTLVRDLWDERLYATAGASYQLSLEPTRAQPLHREVNLLFGNLGLYFRVGEHFSLTANVLLPLIIDTGSSESIILRNSFSGVSLGGRLIF
jgi:hypothetical protein